MAGIDESQTLIREGILGLLPDEGTVMTTKDLVKALKKPKPALNKVLYELQSDGILERIEESPPTWKRRGRTPDPGGDRKSSSISNLRKSFENKAAVHDLKIPILLMLEEEQFKSPNVRPSKLATRLDITTKDVNRLLYQFKKETLVEPFNIAEKSTVYWRLTAKGKEFCADVERDRPTVNVDTSFGAISTGSEESRSWSRSRHQSGDSVSSVASSASADNLTILRGDFEDHYEVISKLGEGGYGQVHHCIYKVDECHYAVKQIPFRSEADIKQNLKEVKCLARLNHANIVRYSHAWIERTEEDDESSDVVFDYREEVSMELGNAAIDNVVAESTGSQSGISEIDNARYNLFIRMELCTGSTLKDWLVQNITRDQIYVKGMFRQIVKAVTFIHSKKYVHGDLKPGNIFLTENEEIKVGDFGLVSKFEDVRKSKHRGGTLLYLSPEKEDGHEKTPATDIYALGLIFLEMLFYMGSDMEKSKLFADAKKEKKLPGEINRKLSDVILKMLDDDEKRPMADDVLSQLEKN